MNPFVNMHRVGVAKMRNKSEASYEIATLKRGSGLLDIVIFFVELLQTSQ